MVLTFPLIPAEEMNDIVTFTCITVFYQLFSYVVLAYFRGTDHVGHIRFRSEKEHACYLIISLALIPVFMWISFKVL